MAFKLDGEMLLPESRALVWDGLNNPEVLRKSIKGCQKLERVSDNEFVAEVKLKIGPVSSVFDGKVVLCDLDPPNSYRIVGQGNGGAAGFAKGGAIVSLTDHDAGTLLRYEVDVEIGGRLAQLGGRLISGVAKKQADMFFESFAAQVAGQRMPSPGAADTGAPCTGAAVPLAMPGEPGRPGPAPDAILSIPAAASSAGVSPSPPWCLLIAIAASIAGGFLLGHMGVDPVWMLTTILIALVSAGAGYRSAQAGQSKR